MRASTSVEKSAGAGAGAAAGTIALSCNAAHSSGKLGGTTSWAVAPEAAAAATHNARTTRRSVVKDRETVLLLEFSIEPVVGIAGAAQPYSLPCSACRHPGTLTPCEGGVERRSTNRAAAARRGLDHGRSPDHDRRPIRTIQGGDPCTHH